MLLLLDSKEQVDSTNIEKKRKEKQIIISFTATCFYRAKPTSLHLIYRQWTSLVSWYSFLNNGTGKKTIFFPFLQPSHKLFTFYIHLHVLFTNLNLSRLHGWLYKGSEAPSSWPNKWSHKAWTDCKVRITYCSSGGSQWYVYCLYKTLWLKCIFVMSRVASNWSLMSHDTWLLFRSEFGCVALGCSCS